MGFLTELNSYFTSGWIAIIEKFMIFFMVFWIGWCIKLYLEPEKNNKIDDKRVTDNTLD